MTAREALLSVLREAPDELHWPRLLASAMALLGPGTWGAALAMAAEDLHDEGRVTCRPGTIGGTWSLGAPTVERGQLQLGL